MTRNRLIGILVSLAILALLLLRVDLAQMAEAIRSAHYSWLPLAVAVYLVSFLARSLRWQALLRPLKPGVSLGRVFSITIVGWTTNNLLPAKAGELARAYLFGQTEGISKTACLATIVVERLFDALTLLVFLTISLLFLADSTRIADLTLYLGIVFGAGVVLLVGMAVSGDRTTAIVARVSAALPERIGNFVRRACASFLLGLRSLGDWRRLLAVTVLSFCVWGIEAAVYWLVLRSFALDVPAIGVLTLLALVNVGVLLPSAPGALGIFQFFCVMGLALFEVGESTALAFSFVLQAVMWLPVTLLGLAFIYRLPAQLRFRTGGT